MAAYTIPNATSSWQALTAPSADAWLQPIGGDIYISTDADPSKSTAGIVTSGVGYPVTSGVAVKIAARGPVPVSVRMWDKT